MLEKLSVQPQDFSKVFIPFQMDEKSIPTVSDQFSYFYLAFVSLEEASCCTLGTPLKHTVFCLRTVYTCDVLMRFVVPCELRRQTSTIDNLPVRLKSCILILYCLKSHCGIRTLDLWPI